MIDFLPFGNFSVAVLAISVVLFAAYALIRFLMFVGNWILATDHEHSPVSFKNHCFHTFHDRFLTYRKWNIARHGGKYYVVDWAGGVHEYSSHEEAQRSLWAEVNTITLGNYWPVFFLAAFVLDVLLLWFLNHFISALIVSTTAGTLVTIRFISTHLWTVVGKVKGHDKRITTLEEKDNE